MPKSVVYIGAADTRVLSVADQKLLGIDKVKDDLVFIRGVPQEVVNDTATILMETVGGFTEANSQAAKAALRLTEDVIAQDDSALVGSPGDSDNTADTGSTGAASSADSSDNASNRSAGASSTASSSTAGSSS